MRNSLSNNQSGFTLIELLVAFILLSFLLSLLYGSFNFANKVTTKNAENSQNAFKVYETHFFLNDLISKAYPEKSIFRGSETSMTFIAPLNQAGAATGLYLITLEQRSARQGQQLLMSWEKKSDEFKQDKYHQGNMVVRDQFTRMEFSYLSTDNPDSQPIWVSQWDQEGELPSHVRIRFANSTETGLIWPEQIIKINVTHNVDCQYDPVSRGCVYR